MTDSKTSYGNCSTAFNDNADAHPAAHEAIMINDNILRVHVDSDQTHTHDYYFDFMMRTVAVMIQSHNTDRIMLFSEMDREVLELHRQKLIDLGGKPMPLPGSPQKLGGLKSELKALP